MRSAIATIGAAVFLACSALTAADSGPVVPKNIAVLAPATPDKQDATSGSGLETGAVIPGPIKYHMGAPVLAGDVKLYVIYYGMWNSRQTALISSFLGGLGTSPWWGIERKYYHQASPSSSKQFVTSSLRVGKTVTDTYSLGKNIGDGGIARIVKSHISAGRLPANSHAVYMVLTSSDVSETHTYNGEQSSFCKDTCGYHLSTQLSSGKRIYYAHVGHPARCLDGCAPKLNRHKSPNGLIGTDALLSVMAHEIAEAVSDPYVDGNPAWYDDQGNESADKCVNTFGATQVDGNGGSYNMGWGGHRYLIQQNWDPVKQDCALSG
ncbi:hypothetical protein HK105_204332 [Polyrhizophydium stewartii]|uniref:Phosphate-induced protein 1 n=1 Tax=Polyrhizophydium stewartii TaxID=2732419 RepID=A0ABR4N9N4_9FUNG|nr:hypothetical protein HK105_002047 [Polyrhizophydium stewartii]